MTLAIITLDEDVDPASVHEFLGNLKPSIAEVLRGFTKHASGNLAESIDAHLEGQRTIRIVSSAPYAKAVDTGSSPRIMWNLINRVVPIKQSGGATIYRKVSLKSILQGKWRYPGTKGINFVERAAELAHQKTSGPLTYRISKTPAVVEVV